MEADVDVLDSTLLFSKVLVVRGVQNLRIWVNGGGSFWTFAIPKLLLLERAQLEECY